MRNDSETSRSIVPRFLAVDANRTTRYSVRRRLVLMAIIVTALVAGAMPALAASSNPNLGPPTNATSSNPYFPLSGFHKTGPSLRSHGLPELLWIGTAWLGDPVSDWERWPLVKALEQFGTFNNLVPARPVCGTPQSYGYNGDGQPIKTTPCTLPTFDWSHAHYRSQHVLFVYRDMVDAMGHLGQRLNSTETKLFDHYVRFKNGNSISAIAASIDPSELSTSGVPPNLASHHFPLVSIGGYLQTTSQVGFEADLMSVPGAAEPVPPVKDRSPGNYYFLTLTFDQVQHALITGQTPSIPAFQTTPATGFPSLVPDINGEANVITALICHADGKKPVSVCGRSDIKQILKHVK